MLVHFVHVTCISIILSCKFPTLLTYSITFEPTTCLTQTHQVTPLLRDMTWRTVTYCDVTGNLGDGDVITEKELRDHFYQYGEIRSVTVVHKNQCAFVQYTARCAGSRLGQGRVFGQGCVMLEGRLSLEARDSFDLT